MLLINRNIKTIKLQHANLEYPQWQIRFAMKRTGHLVSENHVGTFIFVCMSRLYAAEI